MRVPPEIEDRIRAVCSVSRETLTRLEEFLVLLQKWSRSINLVAEASASTLWERHVLDSLQLVPLRQDGGMKWCDLGSGGGFPGVIAGIALREISPETDVVLVESDRRKAAFLAIAARELDLRVTVRAERAEKLSAQHAATVSARALAPLDRLLPFVHRHLAPDGVALLPKGITHEAEISAARRHWAFTVDAIPSIVAPQSRILRMSDLRSLNGE